MKHYIEGTQHLIENYELAKADNFKGWECVSRLKYNDTFTKLRYTSSELQRMGKYWNRPPEELIWMTGTRRRQLDNLLWEKPAERVPFYVPYCPDRYKEIENYETAKKDNFEKWRIYHKLYDTMDPEYVKQNLYYNRPPEELVFVTLSQESRITMLRGVMKRLNLKWKHKDNPVLLADKIGYPTPSDGIPAWDEDETKYSDLNMAVDLKMLGLQARLNGLHKGMQTYTGSRKGSWCHNRYIETLEIIDEMKRKYPED